MVKNLIFKFICCLKEKEEKIQCACMNWNESRNEGRHTEDISSSSHTIKSVEDQGNKIHQWQRKKENGKKVVIQLGEQNTLAMYVF